MSMTQTMYGIRGASALAALAVFLLLRFFGNRTENGRIVVRACREFSGMLRQRTRELGLYARMDGWLKKNGAEFHYGKRIEPVSFAAVSLMLGLIVRAGCLQGMTAAAAGAAGIAAVFLPAILLRYLNRRDNERQLPELKLIYHALEMQIKAGVYVTDALAECYGSVQEKRLRQALLEMAGDIVMKADVFESLDKFQSKFDNQYVDSLCITILQALESGQAIDLLRDVADQIKDMEESVLAGRKAALDRTITFCQLGVLTVVLGLALYACVLYMFSAAAFF